MSMYQFILESGRAGQKRICVGEWRWSTSYGAKFCGALKRNMKEMGRCRFTKT